MTAIRTHGGVSRRGGMSHTTAVGAWTNLAAMVSDWACEQAQQLSPKLSATAGADYVSDGTFQLPADAL